MQRLALLLLVPALLLTSCAARPAPADDGRLPVVTSTDVWGDVVARIGGPAVRVHALINGPAQDPHDYQASPRDQLAVSRARLVVLNGGGYDDVLRRLTAHAAAGTTVLDAAEASGLDRTPASGDFNEHLWYDFGAVSQVAAAIARALARAEPAHRAGFESRLQRFQAQVAALEASAAALRPIARGRGVAVTEPVPLYLTAALGLVDRTPPAFSAAIEEGGEVAPAVLREQLALLSSRRVALLMDDEQTSDGTTALVSAAARAAGVPIVEVRETLPEGMGWVRWMQRDLDAVRRALTR